MATASSTETRNRVAELRQRRRWLPSIWAVGSTFVFLGAAFGLLHWRFAWWTAIPAYLVIGFMQYRLVLAAHEATHKTLMPTVPFSEAVGLFCASLVGVSLFNYRRAHLEHHKYPQSIQDDIDGYIYRPLIKQPPGWPRLYLLFAGNYLDILTKLRRKFVGDGDLEGTHALVGTHRPGPFALLFQMAPIASLQLVVWGLLWWQFSWWTYLVFWLAPIFTMALQLDRIRTFVEHSYNYFYPGPPIGDLTVAPQTTIDVETNFLERYLFAPFGFAEHQAHHAQLTVPFYNLPELREVLEHGQPGYTRRIKASYLRLFARLIHAPVAPEFVGKI